MIPDEYKSLMEHFEFSKAFDYIWEKIQELNKRIDEEKPWEMAKNGETEKLRTCLKSLVSNLLEANRMLSPFLPETSDKIIKIFRDPVIPPKEPLFPKQ